MIERVTTGGDAVVLAGADAVEVGAAVRAATARGDRVGAFVTGDRRDDDRAALDEMVAELYGATPDG